MLKAIIYHNTRCSKSRKALVILQYYTDDIQVINYLDLPPSIDELDRICQCLSIEPTALIRSHEDEFKQLGLQLSDAKTRAEWLEILHQYPKLIERPIVEVAGRTVLGRPPENVQNLFAHE